MQKTLRRIRKENEETMCARCPLHLHHSVCPVQTGNELPFLNI